MTRPILLILMLICTRAYSCFLLPLNTPPDTLLPDTTINQQIEYDTIRTEKIIYEYDTVMVFDTVYYYDSSLVLTERPVFSTGVYGGGNIIRRNFESGSLETSDLTGFKEHMEKQKPGFHTGVSVSAYYKKWTASTGIFLMKHYEKPEYNISTFLLTPVTKPEIHDTSYWNINVIDTFFQVIGTDTTMIIVADSLWITRFDTVLVSGYDTVSRTNSYNSGNSYAYMEFPFMLGRELFSTGKFRMDFRVGLITGILFRVKGKTIVNEEMDIVNLENTPCRKLSFSLAGSGRIKYITGNSSSLFLQALYRKSLGSFYGKNFLFSQKQDYLMISLGFEYVF
ncbi:MAG: hypothetical protein ABIJ16_14550 [Bacteroidota bacterium]